MEDYVLAANLRIIFGQTKFIGDKWREMEARCKGKRERGAGNSERRKHKNTARHRLVMKRCLA